MTDPSYGTRVASSSAIPRRPFAVVVLAAGEGTRMKSARPKVLHGFAGRSLSATSRRKRPARRRAHDRGDRPWSRRRPGPPC